jgi:PAS domain S-box-containing protein
LRGGLRKLARIVGKGELIGVRGVDKEITEPKQMEKNGLNALDYAENIVATIREALLVLDANLRVVSASRSFYSSFEVTSDETEGRLIYELGNMQWDIPGLRALLEQILPRDTVFDEFEVEHDFETIGKRVMLLNARRLYQGAHKAPMILLAIEDITERKRAGRKTLANHNKRLAHANRELKSKQEELEEFTYTVSHDLKAPVVSIQGFAKLLQERLTEQLDEKSRKYLGRIVANCDNMATLLKDILDLSLIRRIEEERKEIDLTALIAEIYENFSATASEKGIQLESSDYLPAVFGRQGRIKQVFANLVDNAIKYMPQQDRSLVQVGYDPDIPGPKNTKGAFFVRDNGKGIPEQFHNKIFKIFQRVPSTANKGNSTGIGLTIAKRIIERQGGNIWLESAPDKGATFYFTLPLADAREEESTNSEAPNHVDGMNETGAETPV